MSRHITWWYWQMLYKLLRQIPSRHSFTTNRRVGPKPELLQGIPVYVLFSQSADIIMSRYLRSSGGEWPSFSKRLRFTRTEISNLPQFTKFQLKMCVKCNVGGNIVEHNYYVKERSMFGNRDFWEVGEELDILNSDKQNPSRGKNTLSARCQVQNDPRSNSNLGIQVWNSAEERTSYLKSEDPGLSAAIPATSSVNLEKPKVTSSFVKCSK